MCICAFICCVRVGAYSRNQTPNWGWESGSETSRCHVMHFRVTCKCTAIDKINPGPQCCCDEKVCAVPCDYRLLRDLSCRLQITLISVPILRSTIGIGRCSLTNSLKCTCVGSSSKNGMLCKRNTFRMIEVKDYVCI